MPQLLQIVRDRAVLASVPKSGIRHEGRLLVKGELIELLAFAETGLANPHDQSGPSENASVVLNAHVCP